MVRARRDAQWSNYHVHDPSGVVRLRHARIVAVATGDRCDPVPSTNHIERDFLLPGWICIFLDRLHIRAASLVDRSGFAGMWNVRRRPAFAQLERDQILLEPQREDKTATDEHG